MNSFLPNPSFLLLTTATVLFGLSSLTSTANADLVLGINTANKTFSLTGSDSGNIGTFGDGGIAQWEIVLPGSGAGFSRSAAGDMFSVSAGAPSQAFGYDTEINVQFSGLTRLTLLTTQSGPATITGEDVFLDYSSFSISAQSRLESAIGQSLTLNVGGTLSGFSSISVVQVTSPVPEPTTPVLLGLFGVAFAGLRRRNTPIQ